MHIPEHVRLDDEERRALIAAVADFDGDVYLIGSRTDPKRRGGDVDIIVIPNNTVNDPLDVTQKIRREFQKICDEKIDIALFTKTMDKQQKAFFQFVDKVKLK